MWNGPASLGACSFGWWLMAGAGLFWEKSTVDWLLMSGLLWEKSTAGWWLISQTNRAWVLITHTGLLSGKWSSRAPALISYTPPVGGCPPACCWCSLGASMCPVVL
jgi:hypothetical protein